jgi:hypothetical protein
MKEATKNFTNSIELAPKSCKYYIARARSKFLNNVIFFNFKSIYLNYRILNSLNYLKDKLGAQVDICVSIVLDPTNVEIPSIIARIFPDQNLTKVLDSPQMLEAKYFLKKNNIKSVLE